VGMSKGLCIVLAEDQHEVLELHYPRLRFDEAGYEVKLVGPKGNKEKYSSKEGYWAFSDLAFKDVDPKLVKALVVPGGLLCPDRLRRYEECLDLVRKVHENGGVCGFICHGPWVAISAKVIRGVKSTCFFSIKDDLINAGGEYSTERVVVDAEKRIVTAQTPNDCGLFMREILKLLENEKGKL